MNIQNYSYSIYMHVFYAPAISEIPALDNEESAHAIRVLRLQKGDTVFVTDGKGGFYEAKIAIPDVRNLGLEIIKNHPGFGARPYYLHIAIAPTKHIDRFEFFLEKATEIGIDEITPLLCRYSERDKIKYDRLERILVSAIKQSHKAYKPVLNELTPFNDLIHAIDGTGLIAHCSSESKPFIGKLVLPGAKITVLIGPEGDFSDEEITLALNGRYQSISLGNSILRTETAGIIACSAVYQANALNG